MPSILIELTNRCNLSCKHCLDGRHGGEGGDLKMEIIEKILQSARAHGFDDLSFTGGEPTLHPRFIEILTMAYEAGYKFGFVTNGWNFTKIYETSRGLHLREVRDNQRRSLLGHSLEIPSAIPVTEKRGRERGG